jgi:hypothetical protein
MEAELLYPLFAVATSAVVRVADQSSLSDQPRSYAG